MKHFMVLEACWYDIGIWTEGTASGRKTNGFSFLRM